MERKHLTPHCPSSCLVDLNKNNKLPCAPCANNPENKNRHTEIPGGIAVENGDGTETLYMRNGHTIETGQKWEK